MTRSNGIRKTDEIPISDMDDASVTREAIRDELGAQNSYSQYARQTKDPKAKRVYKDISREEGEHVGELAQVYSEQDPDAVKDMNEGRKEVKNMKSAKKSGAQPNKKSGHIEKYSTEELDKIYAQKKKRPVAEPIDKDDIGGGMTALQEFASMGKGRKAQNMKTALEAAKEMADILGYEGAQRVNFMIGMVKDMTDMHEKNYQDQMTLNRAALDTEKARERKEAAKQPVSNAHTDVNAIVSRGKRDDGTYMTDVLPGKKIPSIISPDDGKKEEEEADVETDKKIFPASGKKDKKPQGELKEVLSVTEQVPHVRGEDPVPTTRPGANDMHNQHLSTFNAEEEGKQILQNHAVNEAHKKKKEKREEKYAKENAKSQKLKDENGSLRSQGLRRKKGKNVKKEDTEEPTSKKMASASMHIEKRVKYNSNQKEYIEGLKQRAKGYGGAALRFPLGGKAPVTGKPGGDMTVQPRELMMAMRNGKFYNPDIYPIIQRDFLERYGWNPAKDDHVRKFYSTMPLVQDFLEYVPEKKRGFRGRGFPTGHAFPDIDWQHVPGGTPVIPTYLPKLARNKMNGKGYFRIHYPGSDKSEIIIDDTGAYERAMNSMMREKDPDTGRPQGRRVIHRIDNIEGMPPGTYIEPVYSGFRSYRLSGRNKDRLMYYAALKNAAKRNPNIKTLSIDPVWVPSKWDYLHHRKGSYMPEFAVRFDEKRGEYVPALKEKEIDQALHDAYVGIYGREPEEGIRLNRAGGSLLEGQDDDIAGGGSSLIEDNAYEYAKKYAGDDEDILSRPSVQNWMMKVKKNNGTIVRDKDPATGEEGDAITITLRDKDGTEHTITRTMEELKEWSDYMFDARMAEYRKYINIHGGDLNTPLDVAFNDIRMHTDGVGKWVDALNAPKPDPRGIKKQQYAQFMADEWMGNDAVADKFRDIFFSGEKDVPDDALREQMVKYAEGRYEELLAGDQDTYLNVMRDVDKHMFKRQGIHIDELSDDELLATKDAAYPNLIEGFGEKSTDPSLASNGRRTRDYWGRNDNPGSEPQIKDLGVHAQELGTMDQVIEDNIKSVIQAIQLVNGVENAWRNGKDGKLNGPYGMYSGLLEDIGTGQLQYNIGKDNRLEVLRRTSEGMKKDEAYTDMVLGMIGVLNAAKGQNVRLIPGESPENEARIVDALANMTPEQLMNGIVVDLSTRQGGTVRKRYDSDAIFKMLASASNRYARYMSLDEEMRNDYDIANKIISRAISNDMSPDKDIETLRTQAESEAKRIPIMSGYSYTEEDGTPVSLTNRFMNPYDAKSYIGRKGRRLKPSSDDMGGELRDQHTIYGAIFDEERERIASQGLDSVRRQLIMDAINKYDPKSYDYEIENKMEEYRKNADTMGISYSDAELEEMAVEAVNKDLLERAEAIVTDDYVERAITHMAHDAAKERYVEGRVKDLMTNNDDYRRKYSGLGEMDSNENAMKLHDEIEAIHLGLNPDDVGKEDYTGPRVPRQFAHKPEEKSAETIAMDEYFAGGEEKKKTGPTPKPKARAQEKAAEEKKAGKKKTGNVGAGKKGANKDTGKKGTDNKGTGSNDAGKGASEKKPTVPAPHNKGRQINAKAILGDKYQDSGKSEETEDLDIEDTFKSMSFRDIYNRRRNDVINKYRGM